MELVDWILNGYDGEIDIDPEEGLLITGTTGWRAALKSAIEERIGDTIFICVYDDVWGEGSNATFHITRFLPIRLDLAQLTGKDRFIMGTVQVLATVPDGETGGTGDDLAKVHRDVGVPRARRRLLEVAQPPYHIVQLSGSLWQTRLVSGQRLSCNRRENNGRTKETKQPQKRAGCS